jgi:hypothetical protein
MFFFLGATMPVYPYSLVSNYQYFYNACFETQLHVINIFFSFFILNKELIQIYQFCTNYGILTYIKFPLSI